MGDLDRRVSRLERELRVWRVAAVACVAVLSCKGGGAPASPGVGRFSSLTIEADAEGQRVEVTPWGMTITAPDGDTSRLQAGTMQLDRQDGDFLWLTTRSIDVSRKDAGTAMLAAHGLTFYGPAGSAALYSTPEGGQMSLSANQGANTLLSTSGDRAMLVITDDDRVVAIDADGLRH